MNESSFDYFFVFLAVSISLMSLKDEYLTICENKINNYLKRSIFKMKLDGFQHWNQYLINAFYKYSVDRCVLPKTDHQQQIILYGPVSNVYEVNQKYQLTNALIQQKQRLSSGFPITIMISYSREDSIVSHRLANRLIDEGFFVWINSDQSIEFEKISKKIHKSSCIILCISENYYQNSLCLEEAKYAFQTDKKVFLVKIQNNPLLGWDYDLFEGKLFFHSFGSEDYFDFEYGRLLLELVSNTMENFFETFFFLS